tara:strand:- start:288 stop:410 length:123 start_codon:yes stop_codon:yes gene_type:complete
MENIKISKNNENIQKNNENYNKFRKNKKNNSILGKNRKKF